MEKFDKIKYNNNYNKKSYYSPSLSLPAEYREILQAKGKEHGSITSYIKHLIDRDLTQNGCSPTQ